jgi:hypothetical protein
MANGIKDLDPNYTRTLTPRVTEHLRDWAKSVYGLTDSEFDESISEWQQGSRKPKNTRGIMSYRPRNMPEMPKRTPERQKIYDAVAQRAEYHAAGKPVTGRGSPWTLNRDGRYVMKPMADKVKWQGIRSIMKKVPFLLGPAIGLAFDQLTAADELGTGEDEILRQIKMGRDN